MEWLFICAALPFILKLIINIVVRTKEKSDYYNCIYSKLSPNSYNTVRKDTGLYGEYLTVKALETIKGNKEFLINVYLPKENSNDETTEIDVLMIHEKGIFVFESKNYSGWIFGKDRDKQWTASLNKSTKNRFYNPIRQNYTHIKALKSMLPHLSPEYFKSVIVFSERCELKNLNLATFNVPVIKRNYLYQTVQSIINESSTTLSFNEIDEVLSTINAYANANQETKDKHINNINEKYRIGV